MVNKTQTLELDDIVCIFNRLETCLMPFLSIQDGTFPFVCFGESSIAKSWAHGEIYNLRMASVMLRLTTRGMQYTSRERLDSDSLSAWHQTACHSDMNALCVEKNSGMRVFPTDEVSIPDSKELMRSDQSSYLLHFPHDTACNSSHTGRVRSLTDTTYDLSLCDLLDANLDLIFVDDIDNGGRLLWREDKTPWWLLLFMGLAAIYLVSCIAQNIVNVVNKNMHIPVWQRLVTFGVLVMSVWSFVFAGESSYVILHTDKRLMWQLILYVSFELVMQILSDLERAQARHATTPATFVQWLQLSYREVEETGEDSQKAWNVSPYFASSISILTACLLLITLRIHFTMDNPYVVVLTLIFGIRSFYKFLWVCMYQTSLLEQIIQKVDMMLFISLLGNGVASTEYRYVESTLMQFFILFISLVSGALLLMLKPPSQKT